MRLGSGPQLLQIPRLETPDAEELKNRLKIAIGLNLLNSEEMKNINDTINTGDRFSKNCASVNLLKKIQASHLANFTAAKSDGRIRIG